jgi:hypothetical protein
MIPLPVDGMIVASSMALLLDSRLGRCGGVLPRALLITGAVASLVICHRVPAIRWPPVTPSRRPRRDPSSTSPR